MNEISSAGISIKYAPEATAGTRPTSDYLAKAATGTMNIADYVTGISGLQADYDTYDVTPLSETKAHRFIRGLMSNDGNITFAANINKVSRTDWGLVVDAYETAAGAGKDLWFEITLNGDTESFFFSGEPCDADFPDVEAGSAVQGNLNIILHNIAGWNAKSTT